MENNLSINESVKDIKMDHSSYLIESENKKENYSFNLILIKKIHFLNKLIMSNWRSMVGMLILLSLNIGNVFVVNGIGTQSSKFYDVIGNKKTKDFYVLIYKLLFLVVLESISISIINYVGGILSIWWRQKLTDKAHMNYLNPQSKNYYKMSKIDTQIDNPDQRIAHDIDQFSSNISQVYSKILLIPFMIGYYTFQMWKLMGYIGPCVVFMYFFMGSFVNKLLMSPLVNLIYQQEKFEGDFRTHHLGLRSNCEEVAMLSGETTELQYLASKFNILQNNKKSIVKKQFFLDCSTNIFAYVGSIVSYIMIGMAILKFGLFKNITNQAELGTLIALSSFYTLMLIYNFSQIIELSTLISDLSGYSSRIFQLFGDLDPEMQQNIEENNQNIISFQDVSFNNIKSNDLIVKDLSFEIKKKDNLLIIGRSGVGKSSILRVISKLWPVAKGKISLQENIFFLPQQPYLFHGSLLSQISYPLLEEEENYETKIELLKIVRLNYLIKRFNCHENFNWPLILSPGEQQKLCLARLLFHKPSFAILDEASSALGLDDEELFYKLCGENEITVVSIGHRPTLMKFHQFLLVLKEKGKWEFTKIDVKQLKENHYLKFF